MAFAGRQARAAARGVSALSREGAGCASTCGLGPCPRARHAGLVEPLGVCLCARACASCARVAGGGGRPKAGVREGQSVIRDRVVTQVVVRTLGSVQGSGTLSCGKGRFLGDPRSLQWGS